MRLKMWARCRWRRTRYVLLWGSLSFLLTMVFYGAVVRLPYHPIPAESDAGLANSAVDAVENVVRPNRAVGTNTEYHDIDSLFSDSAEVYLEYHEQPCSVTHRFTDFSDRGIWERNFITGIQERNESEVKSLENILTGERTHVDESRLPANSWNEPDSSFISRLSELAHEMMPSPNEVHRPSPNEVYPPSTNGEGLVQSYRQAIDFALEEMAMTVRDTNVPTCTFLGFSREVSSMYVSSIIEYEY